MASLSATDDQRAFNGAVGRLCDTVTRLVGFALVLIGAFALYSGHTSGVIGSAHTLELFAFSLRFTDTGPLGSVAVYHQVLGFGFFTITVGVAIVLGSTRRI